jgi:outer membrane protein assembly factor BamA
VLERYPKPGLRVWGGPLMRYTATDLDQDRLVSRQRPRGSDGFGRVGGHAGIEITSGDSGGAPARSVRLSAGGDLFPPVWDVSGMYGSITAEASTWLPLGKPGASPAVAGRVGTRRVWGPFPYDDAAFLGGEEALRGYEYQRFAGNAALYGRVEFHVPVARVFARLIPTRIGVFALGDAGRVWADGTRSSRVHAAAGGGVSLSFFDERHVVSLAVASGDEGSRWHLRTGIGF